MYISVIWNLTKVAELGKTKTTGNDVAKSSIAVSSNTRLDPATNKYVSDSSFYNIEAYKGTATRLAKYPKGTTVHIEGDLTNVSYKAEDGTNKSYLKITVNSITAIKYLSDAELGLGNQVPQTAQVAQPVAPVQAPQAAYAPAPVAPVQAPVQPVAPAMPPVGVDNPLNPSDGWVTFDFSNVQ